MTEKEEKIEQFITIQQRTITQRDYETKDEIISKIYPRKEAIESMAKAIKSVPKASGEAVHSTDYAKWAEAALNTLLDK